MEQHGIGIVANLTLIDKLPMSNKHNFEKPMGSTFTFALISNRLKFRDIS